MMKSIVILEVKWHNSAMMLFLKDRGGDVILYAGAIVSIHQSEFFFFFLNGIHV